MKLGDSSSNGGELRPPHEPPRLQCCWLKPLLAVQYKNGICHLQFWSRWHIMPCCEPVKRWLSGFAIWSLVRAAGWSPYHRVSLDSAQEAVALRDRSTLQLLYTLWSCQRHFPGQRLWPHSAQAFRTKLQSYFRFFRVAHFGYKGYSLRRGGATFLLQQGVPLEAILLRGRWKNISVGRLYLQDGLPDCDLQRIQAFADEVSATAFHP